MSEKLRVFEAFSGIGSPRMALIKSKINFKVVGISEIDKYAIKSYNAIYNESDKLNFGDISNINTKVIPNHDIFIYGFPCQDISLAGKQKGLEEESGTRSSLLWTCERIIRDKKPKYLIMENVKNLVSKKFKPYFDKWLDILEGMGYTNYWEVLNTKDYGIPQNRERVFCVSILGEHNVFKFPKKEKLILRLKDMLEDSVDDKYYLSQEQIEKIKFSNYTQNNRRIQYKNYYDTLCARDFKDPKCVEVEDKIICGQRTDEGLRFFKDNVCGSIGTSNSSEDKRVIECLIGSTQKNAGITDGSYSTTLTSSMGTGGGHVPMVVYENEEKPERLFGIFDKDGKKHQAGSVWDKGKIAPTLDTMQGGWRQPCIIEESIPIKNATKQGYLMAEDGDGIDTLYANQNKRRGRVQKGMSHTITTSSGECVITNKRIRKLTPKECWRLQGFPDWAFDKAQEVNSNSQLYKQAGNTITVDVLEKIFLCLFKNPSQH